MPWCYFSRGVLFGTYRYSVIPHNRCASHLCYACPCVHHLYGLSLASVHVIILILIVTCIIIASWKQLLIPSGICLPVRDASLDNPETQPTSCKQVVREQLLSGNTIILENWKFEFNQTKLNCSLYWPNKLDSVTVPEGIVRLSTDG